jgi:hypothetical protein
MTPSRVWETLRRRIPGVVLVPVLALVALGSWGISSAVGSSPDDDFHLASIWCGDGYRDGLCAAGDAPDEREVAADLSLAPGCYAYQAEVSASCQGEDFGENPDETVSTPRGNFEGLYPPVFYAITGLFASSNIEAAVVAIRVFNAALFIAFATAAFLLIPHRLRPALLGGIVLTIVPLGMFIVPSTNPSSWALLSAGVLWVTTLGYFETTGRRRIALAVVAGLATLLGGGARSDSAVFAGLAIVIAGFLAFRADRRFLSQAIYPFVLGVISFLLFLSGSQSNALATGLQGESPSSPSSWIALFVVNLINVPNLWVGVFGGWGLGWLDTQMPAAVWVGVFGVFVGAIALGLRSRDRRTGVAMLAVLALLFLLPCYILTQSNGVVGGYYQPRYLMPLILIFGGLAVLDTGRRIAFSRSAIVVGGLVLSLANAAALFVNLRRYLTGLDSFSMNLNADLEWWWPVAPSPMAVWIIGSAAFAGAIAALAVPLWAAATPPVPRGPVTVPASSDLRP